MSFGEARDDANGNPVSRARKTIASCPRLFRRNKRCEVAVLKNHLKSFILSLAVISLGGGLCAPMPVFAQDDEVFTASVRRHPYQFPEQTVIGSASWLRIKKGDTLLDIARRFGLGWNEIELLYPKMEAFIPPAGTRLMVPTLWVLPPTQHHQLLINVPELRLYFFEKGKGTVQTYPIGIGDEGWETPLGTFSITEKRPNPTWYIPASLQEKYGMAVMPPGPENPLGEFMMKFSAGAYGVHGTAQPWGVGRLVSHGCIRCYPEHIRILYPQVPMGTRLEIIYEPVKFGKLNGQIFVEAHPDVYKKIPDYYQYARQKLALSPYASQVDAGRLSAALRLQNGMPVNISQLPGGDSALKMVGLAP
jgi:L,D-transpeptidase ErfK/SrfK